MVISSVKVIRPRDRASSVLAFADMTIDGGVTFRSMRLIRSAAEDGRPILRMPRVELKSGMHQDVYNPVSAEVRTQMTDAVIAALEGAEAAGVNDFTLEFDVEPAQPDFSRIRIRKFPGNRTVKAFTSCILDESIAMNRMAILLDEETKALRISMPSYPSPRGSGNTSFYRLQQEQYGLLYNGMMEAYAAPDEEESA